MTEYSEDHVSDVTVVGAGTMGHGIAQTFAAAGYDVTLTDIDEEILEKSLEKIRNSLEQLDGTTVEETMDRIRTTVDREAALATADFVVEAVPEDIDIKREVFEQADDATLESTILATNTSTLPITEIAAATDTPERVVGMHFSNPVQLMPIVEVIRGEETSDAVVEATRSLGEAVGKTPVLVEKDVPGFLINRINVRFWLEAVRRVDAGDQEPEAVDAAVRRLGFPMGPFELLDFSGIDVVTMAAEAMAERGVSVHVPDLLTEKVERDHLGMKTGEGFYEYPAAGEYERVDIPRERRYEFDPYYMIAPAVNEAVWLLDNDVTTEREIDKAVEIGMNWPRGLLTIADEYGLDRIVETLDELAAETGWAEYECHPSLREMAETGDVGQRSGRGFYDWAYEHHEFETVQYERREFTAWITLNRPEKLNAMDRDSWRGLKAALEHAEADDDVRATVLTGAGRAFSAGDDIAELRGWESTADGVEMFEETLLPAVEALRTHPKPTVALVEGVATGGGCELVLLCDLAVCSTQSSFGLPEARIGALPPFALTYGLLSLDRKRLMELALTGDTVPGREAAEMGIVNYAVDGGQAPDVARELTRATTASSPSSAARMADIVSGVEEDFFAARVRAAVHELVQQTQTEEGQRGLTAFLDGEDPPWKR